MYEIKIERRPDLEQLSFTQLFDELRHLPGASYLASGSSNHPDAKYNIIVASPTARIEQDAQGNNWIINDIEKVLRKEDLFSIINVESQKLFGNHKKPSSSLPFLIGALGFSGYDVGKTLERMPSLAEHDYSAPVASVGLYHWSLIQELKTNHVYLCYSSQYSQPDIQSYRNSNKVTAPFKLSSEWRSNMTQSEYLEKFKRVQDYLVAGDSYQVNLAQRFTASFKGDHFTAFESLLVSNDAPFSAYICGVHYSIASCSPERFLSVKDNQVQTKPIKGTRPKQSTPLANEAMIKELKNSAKDRAENLMIVDLLRNDLSKSCLPHSVKVDALFDIESFPAVHHLVSTISATLSNERSSLDLLKGAFPGGSITGAPKIRSMEIIDELEPNTRHVYCGSVFYSGICGDMDSNICIRTLLFENGKVHCWAGGGIVADSQGQLEYEETLHKVDKILPILSKLGEELVA